MAIGKNEPERVWDADLQPLMKVLLVGKKAMKTKEAAEVGKKKIDYFRGKDFTNWLLEHPDLLKRKCQKALDTYLEGEVPTDKEQVKILGQELLLKDFFTQAVYAPLAQKKEEDGSSKGKKWPDRLEAIESKGFDPEGFYILRWEPEKKWQTVLLCLLILGILTACMWPAWPLWAKIGVWYLTVVFLTFWICLELTRGTCYTAGWVVGCEFWIFPNLNDEYAGFVDSFKPVVSFERRKDGAMMLLSRVLALVIIGVGVEQISRYNSLTDFSEFVTGSYVDVIDWGKDKLINALPEGKSVNTPSLEYLQAEAEKEAEEEAREAAAAAAGIEFVEREEVEEMEVD